MYQVLKGYRVALTNLDDLPVRQPLSLGLEEDVHPDVAPQGVWELPAEQPSRHLGEPSRVPLQQGDNRTSHRVTLHPRQGRWVLRHPQQRAYNHTKPSMQNLYPTELP